MKSMGVNYRAEHERLYILLEKLGTSCIDIQEELSGLRDYLKSIREKSGTNIEIDIDLHVKPLYVAELLLDVVRDSIKKAQGCLSMRDENGEMM